MSAPVEDVARTRFEDAMDAAKVGDQHRIRLYLDRFGGNVNLRDRETQGTLLHVSTHCCSARSPHLMAQSKPQGSKLCSSGVASAAVLEYSVNVMYLSCVLGVPSKFIFQFFKSSLH